ncbi:hydroxyethylthiazole kinase [Rapidithrix thailandica]|uniref:Hydroxyethylthiazole kinase n=1 Tax=Rapidithrix thailandica TaxID=413964 RepID=A0AAW9S958_9BACT
MKTYANIWQDIVRIREKKPLIHNITNMVVMNATANALLALGASPVMAHAPEEVEDMTGIAGALVINMGTLDARWVTSMKKAALHAKKLGKPVVFDPVGVGATAYRTQVAKAFLEEFAPDIVRGNASEIMALAGANGLTTKGVDSSHTAEAAHEAAKELSEGHGIVVVVSGSTDYIVYKEKIAQIRNGMPMMAQVTGMGCTATALCAAFAAVNPDYFEAAVGAMGVMGISGENAGKLASGPGSLYVHFLDSLYQLEEKDILKGLKI